MAAAWRGGLCFVDCLPERCQSAACARYNAAERGGTASCAGGNALATVHTIYDGECCSSAPGGSPGRRTRVHSVESNCDSAAAIFHSNGSGCAIELARFVFQFGANRDGGDNLRLRTSVADF